ncbi:hypothetical protein D3C72_2262420 [compost metagenome]
MLIAVARINQPQYLPFTLRQRAGADQFRHLRVRQQAFDKVLIKVREFMSMMLIYLTQNTLGAVLVQLRQRIELNQLAQLLRHDFAFNHKVADKTGTIC